MHALELMRGATVPFLRDPTLRFLLFICSTPHSISFGLLFSPPFPLAQPEYQPTNRVLVTTTRSTSPCPSRVPMRIRHLGGGTLSGDSLQSNDSKRLTSQSWVKPSPLFFTSPECSMLNLRKLLVEAIETPETGREEEDRPGVGSCGCCVE